MNVFWISCKIWYVIYKESNTEQTDNQMLTGWSVNFTPVKYLQSSNKTTLDQNPNGLFFLLISWNVIKI